MADLTPEQLDALLEEKLRPIHEKLDQVLRHPERSEGPDGVAHRLRRGPARVWAFAGGLLATVVVVLLAGRFILASSDGGANQSVAGSGRVLYADDFTNPATGLFLGRQDGNAVLPGDRAAARWDYAYQDGALVAHVGPPSAPLGGRLIGGSARSANPVLGSFAVEVKAKATSSPEHAVYGLRFFPGSRDFAFGIRPQEKTFEVWEVFKPAIVSATNPVIEPPGFDNLLRMEVRGAAVRLFVNGQPLRALQDEAFGARPASVGVFFDSTASPTEPPVEVRYADFKVFSLS